MDQAEEVLQEVFGFKTFKNNQKEIINEILRKKENVLAIMPTGSGKSLCFQIPGLLQKNTTIVISPLIALMKDQVDNLNKKGIDNAHFYNSTLEETHKEKILNKLRSGFVKILYCAPETIKQQKIEEVCKDIPIDLLVIDEAHCVSLWGHNFRPDYLRIKNFHKKIHSPQILALTATATKNTENDILTQLGIKARIFRTSFDRPNLTIKAINIPDSRKEFVFLNLIKNTKQPIVVFVTRQKTAENISAFLQSHGFNSKYYHAGLTKKERDSIQDSFMKNDIKILVATIAFGMGIDKKDIRTIIHFNIPKSIENFYQEIGRSGRDGKIAECITLVSEEDVKRMKNLVGITWPKKDKIEKLINYLNKKEIFITTIRKLAYECEIDEIAVDMILHQLEKENKILTQPDIIYDSKINQLKNVVRIIKNTELTKDFTEKISEIFNKKRKIDIIRIDQLIKCLKDNECIRHKILGYFGENYYKKRCNNCSACSKHL